MKQKLVIGWLYPDLMSIYGDRGNITVLKKRCEWRGIEVEIRKIDQTTSEKQLAMCDLLMMGGAQDSQQTIVAKDLEKKKTTLSKMIESGIPGLYVCGGFQFLGKYYKEADGSIIKQLGVLDVYTENPGGKRLIGNIAIQVDKSVILGNGVTPESGARSWTSATSESDPSEEGSPLVGQVPLGYQDDKLIFLGFENHGGRTKLGPHVKPLGKVLKGYGSNAEDATEGAVYKNSIGTYFHGPILPKNPELADWLITKALQHKYKKSVILGSETTPESRSWTSQDDIVLAPLNDSLSQKARNVVLQKLHL